MWGIFEKKVSLQSFTESQEEQNEVLIETYRSIKRIEKMQVIFTLFSIGTFLLIGYGVVKIFFTSPKPE